MYSPSKPVIVPIFVISQADNKGFPLLSHFPPVGGRLLRAKTPALAGFGRYGPKVTSHVTIRPSHMQGGHSLWSW